MSNKKVTLSISEGVYDNYQKYCKKNAIMLSKRIEIFMMEELQNDKKYSKKN